MTKDRRNEPVKATQFARYLTVLLAATATVAFDTSPAKAECNPNGTENQIIGCVDEANAALKKRLIKAYPLFLSRFEARCAEQNPGGGSGGHSDRAQCLAAKLKEEKARVGLPN
jgi:uncharacterized protein YecT (DUF1311 family)